MTLDQLRIFVAVAEREHVTAAARMLNLAQSAASHAIATLEEQHDTRLFDRVGRRVALTEAGRSLLVEARAILMQVEHAKLMLGEFGKLERGRLAIQASQTIAGYWLPRHLVAFRRSYPGIAIDLAIGNSAQTAQAVVAGTAELGFVEGEIANDLLEVTEMARDQLIVVVGDGHPWASAPSLKPVDLLSGQWVLREPGSGTRSVFEAALEAAGLSPSKLEVVMQLPSNEAVRAAVESGLGATAISASVAASGIEAGLLHKAGFTLPERRFNLLCHRNRRLSRAAQALIDVTAARAGRADQHPKPG